jgi:glutaredoxin 3
MGMSSSTPVAEVIASAPVVVFAASWCPFCKHAKDALKEAGIEFKDVEVTDAQKAELRELTGKTSVPQVFVKGQFIGGCNDGGLGGTVPLLKSGKLQEMLEK